MTAHACVTLDPDCYRCQLHADEIEHGRRAQFVAERIHRYVCGCSAYSRAPEDCNFPACDPDDKFYSIAEVAMQAGIDYDRQVWATT